MPPQQPERLLDLGDDCFGFGAHGVGGQRADDRRQISDIERKTSIPVATISVDRRQYNPPVPVRTTLPPSGALAVGMPLASAPITE